MWASFPVPQTLARNGVIDLRGLDLDKGPPVELVGEWGFAWMRFTDPRQNGDPALASAGPAAVATVPGSWTRITADGKSAGSDGHASYSLQVLCADSWPAR